MPAWPLLGAGPGLAYVSEALTATPGPDLPALALPRNQHYRTGLLKAKLDVRPPPLLPPSSPLPPAL